MLKINSTEAYLTFNNEHWQRYEDYSSIQYHYKGFSNSKAFMFSGKTSWLFRESHNSMWKSCEEPEIHRAYRCFRG